jgi:hypothetical protein
MIINWLIFNYDLFGVFQLKFMSLNPIYVKSINSRPMTHQHCLMDSLIVTIMWDAFYKVWSKWVAFKKTH